MSTAPYRVAVGPAILRSVAITAIIVGVALGPVMVGHGREYLGFIASHPLHAPDLSPLLRASAAIQVHVAAVLAATVVGIVLMSGVKGTRLHRTLGWSWAIFMTVTAISALFIRAETAGLLFLKAFAVITLVSVPSAVVLARRHNVARHANIMTGVFIGGIGVAGVLAFLPGRLMWQVFFG